MNSYQSRCSGCSTGNSGNLYSTGRTSQGSEYTYCYCNRYADVPMCIYYGEGYTQQDSLQAIEQSLSQISQTLCAICKKV